jgi:hypothetical protein
MNSHAVIVRTVRTLAVVLSICTGSHSAFAYEATVTRTNWVERWITNLIEIRMPLNRFVNEYHTNWVTEFRTNRINVYTTNRFTHTLTNHFLVDTFRTNFTTAYHTNWKTLDLTNWQTAIVMRTNWLKRTLTNEFLVEALQTNLVTAYQTNWKTLDLTNWQTAIVMKTNWVTQWVTNVVQIDLPSPSVITVSASPADAVPQKETRTGTFASVPSAATACPVVLQASRTARPPNKGQVEVQLKVRGNGASTSVWQVQQWRVEREDRAILCFGQEQEFRRELPPGRYKVEVKVRQDEDGSILSARGALLVSLREVLIEQSLAAK